MKYAIEQSGCPQIKRCATIGRECRNVNAETNRAHIRLLREFHNACIVGAFIPANLAQKRNGTVCRLRCKQIPSRAAMDCVGKFSHRWRRWRSPSRPSRRPQLRQRQSRWSALWPATVPRSPMCSQRRQFFWLRCALAASLVTPVLRQNSESTELQSLTMSASC